MTGGGARLGDFRLLEPLARGGMGVVYRAWQISLDRVVALKLIAPEWSAEPACRQRFRTEALTAAVVEHPHVVPIYEAGEIDGEPYVAMRLIPGADLRRILRRERRLQPARAVRIVGQLADALSAAHAAGIVHRDVKPSNVLLTTTIAGDHVYLADFGLARVTPRTRAITEVGRCVGTLDYTAPEVLLGSDADARSDVYSLGCLLFELLTGRVPFPRQGDAATIAAHLNHPAPKLNLPGSIATRLDRVIGRALAKLPNERYARAVDLASEAETSLRQAADTTEHETRTRTSPCGQRAPADRSSTLAALLQRGDVRVVTVTGPNARCETHLAVEEPHLDGRRTLVLLGPFDPIAALEITLEPPPELIAS
jgi:serine/threonine protein kinase